MATSRATSYVLLATCLAVGLAAVAVQPSEALPSLMDSIYCTKGYIVSKVRAKLLSSSTLVQEYSAALNRVNQRFKEDNEKGVLDQMDTEEKQNYQLRLTVIELQNLKKRIEEGTLATQAAENAEDLARDPCMSAIADDDDDEYDPDEMVDSWNPDKIDEDKEKKLERQLFTELEHLERQAAQEAEMGWSMTPEAKEALKKRTRLVLTDLLNNEARQLALAIITSYLTGGGSIITYIMPLLNSLRFKLIEYLLNAAADVISSATGNKIVIQPMERPQSVPAEQSAPVPMAA